VVDLALDRGRLAIEEVVVAGKLAQGLSRKHLLVGRSPRAVRSHAASRAPTDARRSAGSNGLRRTRMRRLICVSSSYATSGET
jgi:hypothetical protein